MVVFEKIVVFGKSGCFLAKVVVIEQKWFLFGQSGSIREKVVVIGKSGCVRAK